MTELEKALHVILDSYHKYTSDCKTLKKGEMKTLLEKEMSSLLSDAKEASEKLFKDLEHNRHKEVGVEEFVTSLISIAHKKCEKVQPKCDLHPETVHKPNKPL